MMHTQSVGLGERGLRVPSEQATRVIDAALLAAVIGNRGH
jgi:hypothetical protein